MKFTKSMLDDDTQLLKLKIRAPNNIKNIINNIIILQYKWQYLLILYQLFPFLNIIVP